MKYTKSQKQAIYNYRNEKDRLEVYLPSGTKDRIKEYCVNHGISVNQWINNLITQALDESESSINTGSDWRESATFQYLKTLKH